MTPSEIQASARRKYNATGDTFYNDDFFYDGIYEAETILAEEALVIHKVYSTTSVTSQREYSWPTNAIGIRRIEYDGQKLQKIDFRQDDSITISDTADSDTGTPAYYQIWDRTIYLRVLPGDTGKTIKIYSYDMPDKATAGNTVLDTPIHYHKDIVTYIVSEMAAKNQDTNTAQYYRNLWERAVIKAKRWEAKRKRVDQFARVKNVDILPSTHLGVV